LENLGHFFGKNLVKEAKFKKNGYLYVFFFFKKEKNYSLLKIFKKTLPILETNMLKLQ
jgi:hypothetical protein